MATRNSGPILTSKEKGGSVPSGFIVSSTKTVQAVPLETSIPNATIATLEQKLEQPRTDERILTQESADSFTTLVETQVDQQTQIKVIVKKSIAPAADAADPTKSGLISGWYTEYKPLDDTHAIKIESQVVNTIASPLPSPLVNYGTYPLRLPDQLLAIIPEWGQVTGEGGGYGSGTEISATASANATVEGGIKVLVQNGINGDVPARFTTIYLASPPAQSDIPTPVVFFPTTGDATMIITGQKMDVMARLGASGAGGSSSMGSDIRVKSVSIGPIITPGYNSTQYSTEAIAMATSTCGYIIENAQAIGTGKITINIPASSPTTIPWGTWILVKAQPEQWRLGLWVLHLVEAFIPIPAGSPRFTTGSTLPNATYGAGYSQTLAATAGTTPYVFALISASNATGLTLNSVSGIVGGTPTTVGYAQLLCSVTDTDGYSSQQQFTLYIDLSIDYPSNPVHATAYDFTFTVNGGTGPYTFALANGTTLPTGLTLSSAGEISGTAPVAGNYPFDMTVADTTGAVTTVTRTLYVT